MLRMSSMMFGFFESAESRLDSGKLLDGILYSTIYPPLQDLYMKSYHSPTTSAALRRGSTMSTLLSYMHGPSLPATIFGLVRPPVREPVRERVRGLHSQQTGCPPEHDWFMLNNFPS